MRDVRKIKLLLIRHAKAARRSTWEEDDSERPLSVEGFAQARNLSHVLEPYHPAVIYSSPYLRCLQTVEPFALATGLEVKQDDRLGEITSTAALEAFLSTIDPTRIHIACTHGNIIPVLVEMLAGRSRSHLPEPLLCSKASIWSLSFTNLSIQSFEYLEPPDYVIRSYHGDW